MSGESVSLAWVRDFPDRCDHIATRQGELEPCDKPAVAAMLPDDGVAFAVCAHHTRVGLMVPLRTLVASS